MKKEICGQVFKELRSLTKTSYADLAEITSKSAIIKFEAGTSLLSVDKLEATLAFMGFTLGDFDYLTRPERGIEKIYGKLFHTMRFQRGYREDFFENLGVNALRLRLFEDGRIMLPYSILDVMLEQMRIPESDYGHWLNQGAPDYFIGELARLEKAYLERDFITIKQIEEKAHHYTGLMADKEEIPDEDEKHDYTADHLTRQYSDYRILELTAKACQHELSYEEEVEISDFLMGMEH
ncbi:MAG: helix-turn-helix domain-containing protein, partial [Streptococcaceae bacterium]|nr:helix-turn-helix domain-containing protein [Streptococcaceae bacterium]